MIIFDYRNFPLILHFIAFAIFGFLLVQAYFLAKLGKRTRLKYVPAYYWLLLGLLINISRHFEVIPPSMSTFALLLGSTLVIAGLVLMVRQH
jgi:hypothetical protein